MEINKIYQGDVKQLITQLDDNSIDCCVTSPPYFGLRNYTNEECEIGNEQTLEEYIDTLVEVFEEVRRVLKPTGVFYLNIGDSYSGSGKGRNKDGTIHESALTSKQGTNKSVKGTIKGSGYKPNGIKRKELMNVPHRLVLALSDAGWYHRDTIIWAKATSGQVREGSAMPISAVDRFTPSFEYIFMLTKRDKYYFDQFGVKETINPDSILRSKRSFNTNKQQNGNFDNRQHNYVDINLVNMRNVWRINLQPGSSGQHIAGYPEKLVEPCILTATSRKGNCKDCGKPYERILEKDGTVKHNLTLETRDYRKLETSKGQHGKTSLFLTDTTDNYKSIGWKKTCKCSTDEIILPIVLDPFMGSGTTALVALQNKCDFIGFELNPESIEIANKRISNYLYNNKFY
jgi:DNA modification methylase